MGILNIVNACSHLQNASRARLGLTSIPNNKYNLRLALAMHRAGFLSSVTRAGSTPPSPETILTGAHIEEEVTSDNVASRRLWLGLKYWNNEPVLKKVNTYTKPKRPVTLNVQELERVARGFSTKQVVGLNLGECLFLSTDRGILEIREALDKKVGGLVLCSAS
ncbi:mitochondrial 37s ribosomal protein s8 [Ophiostoma piceae UAMH 11346]|uniref:Mitochondrial 37s ribosomal protein s8 n=1 Tax=Ophiostoma piceae (strain UAMH 11346) TaxID=1262450 RepID=S3DA09_OPHP1|nr:mitochondrial 37s ribosomal protein s8 [Ophiostoma piceae UAMH 11346]